MSARDTIAEPSVQTPMLEEADALQPLLQDRPVLSRTETLASVLVGELVGLDEHGLAPWVTFPGQPGTAALRARSVVDLQGSHVGRSVTLVFENGNPLQPIVMGVLRAEQNDLQAAAPGLVELDTQGQRMFVTAKEQLVLRCGEASITLTKAGKVLIEGKYVSSRSSGVNRIKGGSVQLN